MIIGAKITVLKYVANTLTLINGVLIISVGGVVIYEYAATGGVALTLGSQVIPVAGYTASQWEQAVNHAVKAVDSNKAHHILQAKHLWNRIVTFPTWANISIYVEKVLIYGEDFVNSVTGFHGKRYMIDGYTIEVMYNVVNGVLKIVDAWITN